MIKKLHFKTMLLLCAMIMGIGSAWAADVSYDFTGSDWTVNDGTLSNGTVSFTGYGSDNFKMNSGYFMMGKSGAYINFPTYSSAVEKIVVTGRSGASASTKMNVYVGDVAVSTETTGCTGTNIYEIASDYQAAGTVYTLKVTSSHNAQVTKIEVYFVGSASATYTVTYDCNGGTSGCPDDVTGISAGSSITLAAAPTKTDNTFNGWSDGSTTYEAGASYTVNGDVTMTAQWTANGGGTSGGEQWVLTSLADLTPSDVFVIVGNNGATFAMSNDKGTVSAPTAVGVTVANRVITSTVADNIKWNISSNANDGYIFYPNGSTTTWLYCTSSNNGVRVGTNNANLFTVSEEGYLYHVGTSRYVGIYDSSDWRCYTSINSNITGQTFAFYKYVNDSALPTPQINIDDSGITNNDVYVGTAAGSLVANIFFNNAAIEGATVTWSGNNDEVATINATTGAVTLVAAGNVTFTATFAGNNDYNGATATYEMTVFNNDPNAPGTEDNPYTVAEAMAATPTTGTTGDVYIRGIVSSFYKDNIVGDGTNYRYYISDDGATTTQLLVYKGKGMNNVAFSDADDLLVGDEVVIYGTLTMYQNAPEVASGNYLVSWNRPVNTTPTITVTPTEVDVDADEHEGTLGLTYANLTISDMEDFGIQFYDAAGELVADPEWIEVLVAEQDPQVGEGYVVSYYMFANEGAARTAYFKVYALDDEGNVVYSDLITITQAAYVAPEETIGTFVKVTSTDDITSGQYLIVYEEGSVAFDGSLEGLDVANNTIDVVLNNGTIAATTTNAQSVFNIDVTAGTLQSASGYYIGVKSNSNGLKTSEDAEAYTNSFSIDDNEDAVIAAVFEGSAMSLRYNKASNQERFRYYKDSGQQAIQLYKFVADADDVEVTVTSAGYATYCSEKALDFSDTGLTAYKAILDGSEVSFTEVKQVPAGEGVLLKGDAGSYSVPVAASAAALTDNAFIGVTEETQISETGIFVLLNGDEGVGFYKTTKPFTVGAHTAYLPALAGGSRSFIGLNETTGIKDVNRETITNNRYFDLQGRRVAQPTKGLYIVNGKKVVVK